MPSWYSLSWGWSETAFILVGAVKETLLPLKNTLAADNQEGQEERKPTNLWQVTVIPQLMKLETKLIDMFWMDCERNVFLWPKVPSRNGVCHGGPARNVSFSTEHV